MKRILLTYIFLLVASWACVQAQVNQMTTLRDQYGNQIDPSTQPDNLQDSTDVEIESIPPKLYMWQLDELLGERTIIPADTANLNFQNTNLVEGMYGHYNYTGNLGAPRQSRVFFERDSKAHTLFLEPMSSFYFTPGDFKFTNSNVPYTNLTYYKAGNKLNGEERFKSYFSVNANKRLAFGFNIDYLYGRGYYQNQSISHFNAGLFASYIGEKYQMQAMYNNFYLKMNENGGITDDQYITRPENMAQDGHTFDANSIPVNLDQTSNRNHDFYVYLTHRYRMGFTRETVKLEEREGGSTNLAMKNDSTATVPMDTIVTEEYVPVTSLIHTFKIERSRRTFRSGAEPTGEGSLYENTYLQEGSSLDSTVAISIKNTVGIALLEGFNKYAKAGLTAYATHKMSKYTLMNVDTTLAQRPALHYTEHELYVGGELAKRQGTLLHYRVNGEVGLAGKAAGQFRVNGDLDLNFRLGKDTVNFFARGYVSNTLPSFYMRHYHSNHYSWDDDMSKEFRTRVEGELNIDRWRTNLKAGMENIKNYTYFNSHGLPQQHGGSVQVLSAMLRQDFKLGILHLDNEVVWQKSSNESVLPLPDLSLYHNLYILGKLFKKVLTVQLGADVRYFTKYYAPAYQPALQQFQLQPEENRVELGGYPIVNVYANLHLKRTRIFVMMYHVNAGMGNRNSFLVPHHPINSRLLKIGVSWNFYD